MNAVLTGITDLLFPPRCATCGVVLHEHTPCSFCPACTAGIRFIRPPLCGRCGIPFPITEGGDHLCGECLATEPPYTLARAVGLYEATLLTAIHLFKYRGRTGIGTVLGRIMADYAGDRWDMAAFSLIVPVPLHRRRLRERGFNQALILAREIAKRFSIPLDFTTLCRSTPTAPQVGLGRAERAANVRNAFAIRRPGKIAGRKILLVDDVTTTGSTLSECAAVLMKAEAESVAVLTLARALPGRDAGAVPGFPMVEVQ